MSADFSHSPRPLDGTRHSIPFHVTPWRRRTLGDFFSSGHVNQVFAQLK